MKYSKQQENF